MNRIRVLAASMFCVQAAVLSQVPCTTGWNTAPGSPGMTGPVYILATRPNGEVVAQGDFAHAGGTLVNNIGSWNSANWQAMGAGVAPNSPFGSLAVLPDGNVFSNLSGSSSSIIRWDGANWQTLAPTTGHVLALAGMTDGKVAASVLAPGGPTVQLWDGTAWAPAPGLSSPDVTFTMFGASDGSLYYVITGISSPNVCRWKNGATQWLIPIGFGPVAGETFGELPNGDIVLGGDFLSVAGVAANDIARWDGTQWHALDTGTNGIVYAAVGLPDGSVVAGGSFTTAGGGAANNIARWDGTQWHALGSGTNGAVFALTLLPSGDVMVGGDFTTVDGMPANRVALWSTTCAAQVFAAGAGCPSSGGGNVLTAHWPAWADATFHARGTGLPANAWVLAVTGLATVQPPLPLAALLPNAGPGCNLHVGPEIIQFVMPEAGSAVSQLFLPNSPPIIGVGFHHQMVPIEFDVFGNFVAVTSTNSLGLVVGSY